VLFGFHFILGAVLVVIDAGSLNYLKDQVFMALIWIYICFRVIRAVSQV